MKLDKRRYTRTRNSGQEVYDNSMGTWLPIWIACGFSSHAEMAQANETADLGSADTFSSGGGDYGGGGDSGSYDSGGGDGGGGGD